MSYIVTQELAQLAIDWVLPTIENLMKKRLVKRDHLHIVVVNPTMPYTPNANFVDAIIAERSLGDVKNWQYDYKAIARSKAEITWRTGLPSYMVQQLYPHLYLQGDTVYAGSAAHYGICVACSGVQSYFDQMFSYMIASALQGLAIRDFTEFKEDNPEMDFLAVKVI